MWDHFITTCQKRKRNVNKKYIIMGHSKVIFNKFLKKAFC